MGYSYDQIPFLTMGVVSSHSIQQGQETPGLLTSDVSAHRLYASCILVNFSTRVVSHIFLKPLDPVGDAVEAVGRRVRFTLS